MMPYDACYVRQEVGGPVERHLLAGPPRSPVSLSSERQLCAAPAVVGRPAEAAVPRAHSCPLPVPLGLLLVLRHGRPGRGAAARHESDGCVTQPTPGYWRNMNICIDVVEHLEPVLQLLKGFYCSEMIPSVT